MTLGYAIYIGWVGSALAIAIAVLLFLGCCSSSEDEEEYDEYTPAHPMSYKSRKWFIYMAHCLNIEMFRKLSYKSFDFSYFPTKMNRWKPTFRSRPKICLKLFLINTLFNAIKDSIHDRISFGLIRQVFRTEIALDYTRPGTF